jgi:hypothetical protein
MKPKVVINKIKMPKIANDLFENTLIIVLYTINDVKGMVNNTKLLGIHNNSIPEKR